MARGRESGRIEAALALAVGLGLASAWPAPATAQQTGAGAASGSGSGTGTGTQSGSGLGTTGTGFQSGSGLGTTGTGLQSAAGTRELGSGRGTATMPRGGRGAYDQWPPLQSGVNMTPEQMTAADAALMEQARRIAQPGERSLALERAARAKILTYEFEDAHDALDEAGRAARVEPLPTVRDVRLIGVVQTLLSLGEREMTRGMIPPGIGNSTYDVAPPMPLNERLTWIHRARREWDLAADLAGRIGNPNFRGEMLARTVESQALGAVQVAGEAYRLPPPSPTRPRGEPALSDEADKALARAAEHGRRIDTIGWHDQALDAVAGRAAAAGDYPRGLQVARLVLRPEIRTDAFLKIAESQSRANLRDDATRSYAEAARAVASIPTTDPRITLTGVLIDSLISSGRFDDARASIVLYPDEVHRVKALGAVAKSQGQRGLVDSAHRWIDRDTPVALRSILRRRVQDGVLESLEQARINQFNQLAPTTQPADSPKNRP
ncbi:MAG TPA: hypothetical protein VG406_05295 [Isosphaeraceae bacterium]|jgi:hypothetical protein|nr:hypothetical protein [Isosphaeraceae bacterium]